MKWNGYQRIRLVQDFPATRLHALGKGRNQRATLVILHGMNDDAEIALVAASGTCPIDGVVPIDTGPADLFRASDRIAASVADWWCDQRDIAPARLAHARRQDLFEQPPADDTRRREECRRESVCRLLRCWKKSKYPIEAAARRKRHMPWGDARIAARDPCHEPGPEQTTCPGGES